ncbi:MAG: sugar transferase [Clostridia bacterium]|nr:sugar transferase [Clostridia bacterium]
MRAKSRGIYCRYVKRVVDIVLSASLIFFLLLPMLIISVVIRADSRGKAIFRQKRCGRRGKIFICYKFRTMYCDAPSNIPASEFKSHQKHVTRVGKFLRRTSLDELPQLFNVLKGDMSLVGPRPLIFEETNMHEGRMKTGVYELRPGITGMAQISGRNLLNDDEKLKNDRYYLDNLNPSLDFKILMRTFGKLFEKEA